MASHAHRLMSLRLIWASALCTSLMLTAASAARAAPSQESLRKAFSSKLAGTWGDVYENGAEPALPGGWAMFGCGPQPAFIISGAYKQGFTARAENMDTGTIEGPVVLGEMDSKTAGRIVLPGVAWEQRLTIKNKDLMMLDSVDAAPDKPSPGVRYLKRCK